MNIYNIIVTFISVFFISIAIGQENANTHHSSQKSHHCIPVSLGDSNHSTLSKQQQLALLDRSLIDSIDRHEQCLQQKVQQSTQAGTSAANASGQFAPNHAEQEALESGRPVDVQLNNLGNAQAINIDKPPTEANPAHTKQTSGTTGAANKTIQAKDNTAAVCTMLRAEIAVESNVDKQAKLKDIYKHYRC